MTKIKILILVFMFLLSYQACSENSPIENTKDKKQKAVVPEKLTEKKSKKSKRSEKTKSLLNIVMPKKGEVPIPTDIFAWVVISPKHGLIVENIIGKEQKSSIYPYVYIFYLQEQGKIIVLEGGLRKKGVNNCYPKGKFCYNYPKSITPPSKFKTFKWKLDSSMAQINFTHKNTASLKKIYPKLKMLGLAKFKFFYNGKTLSGTAFGQKGKINEFLQNGFFYVKQLALKEKMYLLRFGKNGKQIAASLLESKIKKLKRGRIKFEMDLRPANVGWIFKKLNKLFKII